MGAFLVPAALIIPPCSTTKAAAGLAVVEALMVAPGAIVRVAPAFTKVWQDMVCSPAGTLVSVMIGPHRSTAPAERARRAWRPKRTRAVLRFAIIVIGGLLMLGCACVRSWPPSFRLGSERGGFSAAPPLNAIT